MHGAEARDEFRKDNRKPEKVMLRTPYFLLWKQRFYELYRFSITTLLLTFARVTRFESEPGHDNKNGIWRVSMLQRRGLVFKKNEHGAEARAWFLELPRPHLRHHVPKTAFFARKYDGCMLAQEVTCYWPDGAPLDAPKDRGQHFSDLYPLEPRNHAPKTLFLTR